MFQLCPDGSFCVEPVLSQGKCLQAVEQINFSGSSIVNMFPIGYQPFNTKRKRIIGKLRIFSELFNKGHRVITRTK